MSISACRQFYYNGDNSLISCAPLLIPRLRGDKPSNNVCSAKVLENQRVIAHSSELTTGTNKSCHGFTLIELLIVIVIIGIVSTVALFAFGDFGASRKAKVTAEQFSSYLNLLEQRAILETSTFGIKISDAGYQTYSLDNSSKWIPMPQKSFFHWQAFPAKIAVQLQSSSQNHNKKPDIIINPSGDMTAFKLFFGTRGNPQLIQLVGKNNGDIALQSEPTA